MAYTPCQRALLGALAAFAASRSAPAQCPQVTQLFGGEGLAGRPYALCSFDDGSGPRLYAGGNFRGAGRESAHSVAVWDGERWAAAGVLPLAYDYVECRALVSHDDGSGPQLFSGAQGYVARWDGAAWQLIGTPGGGTGQVNAFATFDAGSGPELIAAGGFLSMNGAPAWRVARWNGSTWSTLSSGTPTAPTTLAVHDDGAGAKLYAAGKFSVSRWNGSNWTIISQALGVDADVNSLASIRGPSGEQWLLAAGRRMLTNNTYLARWDGVQWHSLLADQDILVESLVVHEDALGPVAYFTGLDSGDGRVWSWRPNGALLELAQTSLRPYVVGMHAPPGATEARLFVGGDFTWIDGTPAQRVAQRVGSQWSSVGVGTHGFIPRTNDWASRTDAIAAWTDERDGRRKVVVGGDFFGNTDDPSLRGLAVWDGERWSSFPVPVPGAVRALATWNDPVLGKEVLVGAPISVGPSGGYVRKFDGVGWVPLGSHSPSGVTLITPFRENGAPHETLFVSGPFIDLTLGLSRIGRFDGTSWVPVGEGIDFGPSGMVVHDPPGPLGPALYVDAGYIRNGHSSLTRISRWDGTTWSSAPSSPNGLEALAVFDDGGGEHLFGFDTSRLYRFDGQSWTEYPASLSSLSNSMAVFDDGSGRALYLPNGQRFRAGQVEQFLPHPSALHASPALAFEDENGQARALWFIGEFESFGLVPARSVARWSDPCRTVSTYCTGQINSQGCVATCEWSGEPSSAASATTPFVIAARDVLSERSGLLFYGRRGPNSAPLGDGLLCVRSPLRRTVLVSSGGTPGANDCSGRLELDFSPWLSGELNSGLEIGALVWCQWWHRDPLAPSGAALSNALTFEIRP